MAYSLIFVQCLASPELHPPPGAARAASDASDANDNDSDSEVSDASDASDASYESSFVTSDSAGDSARDSETEWTPHKRYQPSTDTN